MTHYQNIEFILANGLHCCNCNVQDPEFINIGHKSLIKSRGNSQVSIAPGGVLNDYIPFYFHYKMPMLYHIFKGRVNEYKGSQEDIIYLVSSVEEVVRQGLPFIFTDRHAYLAHKIIYNEVDDLTNLNWDVIKDDTWHTAYSDLKKEVKQSEFLVHQHLPAKAIIGIVTQNIDVASFVEQQMKNLNVYMPIAIKPNFYYI
jgi:hypothetical protein